MTTSSGLTTKNLTLVEASTVLATSFLSVAPTSATVQYAVEDNGADGGYFLLNGVKLKSGVLTDLTAAQMAELQYVAGTKPGVETLTFETLGAGYSATPTTATATSVAPPTLTGKNATIDEGQSIAASSLIASIVNPAGATTTEYAFTDAGTDGGKLLLNGAALTYGKVYDLTTSQLSQLTYVGGSSAGTDTVTIQSYDGAAWSAAATVKITVAPPPTVAVNKLSIVGGQTIQASQLIASVTDPAGDAITQYGFMDSGADGGQLYLNGKALTDGTWYTLTAAQLAQLTYVGGAKAGTDSVSIKVFDGNVWSAVSVAAITETAPTILSELGSNSVETDVAKLMVNNTLSYSSMLTILQDAASGGMTASKFSALQTLASFLDASSGLSISTSTYVADISKAVIDGNGANATWTGGTASPVALGNLTAISSQTQVTELIGEWFLGTDLPNLSMTSVGETNMGATYKTVANPLYGSSGAPSYLDVNQGYDGDCYFMSSIAEVALQDPTAIESMITNDGNGVYGVRFMINGVAEYVTVNSALPTMPSNDVWANGSSLEFANGNILWPELLEKAYAELNAEPNVPHGAQLNAASDSYAGISGGGAYALTEITGQSVSGFNLTPSTSSATLASDNSQLGAAFGSGQELLVGTSNNVTGDLVADHMFEVIGYNQGTDMLTLHNPWGTAANTTLPMTFTESLSALAANDCSLYMTSGKAVA